MGSIDEFRSNAENLIAPQSEGGCSEQDVQRLNQLMHSFCKTEMGRALVDLANERGIKIYFDHQMDPSKGAAYYSYKRTIALNYIYCDELLLCFLAHELRHVWQHKQLPHKKVLCDQKGGTPVMSSIIFNRYLEADACAFTLSFLEDYSRHVPGSDVLEVFNIRWSDGMDTTAVMHGPYAKKIDFYARSLGVSRNFYDLDICASKHYLLDQLEKAPLAFIEFHPAHLTVAQIAAQELRMLDKPFMNIPAPFAHIATDEGFADPERLFLDLDVKIRISLAQHRFDEWFSKKSPQGYLATLAQAPKPPV